ncbi:hypothetical protein, partial [Brucella oryzae]|uniref:hypothetical protein n=1 Tax=Brucella oryzae TaxID=335286 RepID=UPI0035BBE2DB
MSELVWSFCDRFYVYFDLLTPDLQNARVRWDHLIFQFLRGAALMIRAFLYLNELDGFANQFVSDSNYLPM